MTSPTSPLKLTSDPTMNGNGGNGAVGGERINTDIVTLTRFLTEEQSKHKEATGDFTSVPLFTDSFSNLSSSLSPEKLSK